MEELQEVYDRKTHSESQLLNVRVLVADLAFKAGDSDLRLNDLRPNLIGDLEGCRDVLGADGKKWRRGLVCVKRKDVVWWVDWVSKQATRGRCGACRR